MRATALLRRAVILLVAAAAFLVLLPTVADAHSLGSSTIAVRITDDGVEATVSLATDTLDEALGTGYAATDRLDADDADQVIAYLDDHLTVTGTDGTVWTATWSDPVRETVEGIDSLRVDVAFDEGGADTSRFTLSSDVIIEAVPDHEAVVVLTASNGDISTVGVLDAARSELGITDSGAAVPVGDLVGYGISHVLEGADHLLFLLTLLLPAPLMAVAGRWRPGPGVRSAAVRVVHVVTSFTIGHSLTLVLSTMGWVSVPGRPVEIVIAVSVGVSALHAIRPLIRRGEELIAVGFGLVHGLAFAGILTDLGIDGSTSVVTLLAFNIGIEVAQLLVTALVFPSIFVLSRTRFGPAARCVGAALALAASLGWALDRLGLMTNPLAGVEDAAIDHPWMIVLGLAVVALTAALADPPRREPGTDSQRRLVHHGSGPHPVPARVTDAADAVDGR